MSNPVGEFVSGVGLLARGLSMMARRPKLFILGAIPPLITSILFVVGLIALISNAEALMAWATPFADRWADGVANVMRIVIGLGLIAGAVLVMVISFSTVTLALGFPLYDKISELVESELGDPPAPRDEPVLTGAVRSVRQSLALISVSLIGTIVLFFAGLIPLLGQVAIPVVSATFGGWMLGIELIGAPFERRGLLTIADRRTRMQRQRFKVLGFAIPSFMLLAIPFVSVVVFPIATAAGTILARDLIATDGAAGRRGGAAPDQQGRFGEGSGHGVGPVEQAK